MTMQIVAVAAHTAVGLVAETTAAAVRAGICRLTEHPFLVDAMGEPLSCGAIRHLDPQLLGGPRLAALARAALDEIIAKLGAVIPPGAWLIVVLPEPRTGFDDDDERDVIQAIHTFSAAFRVEVGPRGHAGALASLVRAHEALQRGAPLVVVLAVDSYLDPETLRGLDAERRLPGSTIRGAFPPGEASAAFALAPAHSRHGWQPLALVRGTGVATEPRSRDDEVGTLGEGLTAVLRAAAASLRLPDEAVDDLYGDINGERARTDDWAYSMLRFPGVARRATDYRLFTDLCGDVGAATGALACALAIRAWQRGYASGPRALVWAGSDGGLRAASILEQPLSAGRR